MLERTIPYYRIAVITGAVLLLHAFALWALHIGPSGSSAAPVVPVRVVRVVVVPEALHAHTVKPLPVKPQTSLVLPTAANPSANPVAPRLPVPQPAPNALAAADGEPLPIATTVGLAHQNESTVAIVAATTTGGLTQAASAAPILVLPSTDAYYLNNPKAPYPRMSRSLDEQGTVLVRVFIGVDGLAQKVELKKSSGFDRLDQSALATALKWRYVPGTRDGVAQSMDYVLPITFKLSE